MTTEEDLQTILRAVAALKKGKSAVVDNIPAELVQVGGEYMIDVLTKIWKTREWPTPWTQSLIISLPQKGNLQLCQDYKTTNLQPQNPVCEYLQHQQNCYHVFIYFRKHLTGYGMQPY